MFIGHTKRYLLHLREWQTYGMLIAEERRRTKGLPEHGMLFSRGDGSPLQQSTVRKLFREIDKAIQITYHLADPTGSLHPQASGFHLKPHGTL